MVDASVTHVSVLCFYPSGNDLGVAFDIPQHVKNQPIFAACVLKVRRVKEKLAGTDFTSLS